MKVNVVWFRRDLRLEDNVALHAAASTGLPVLPLFIFDPSILDKLEDKRDRRVCYIHTSLTNMQQALLEKGATLVVMHDLPVSAFAQVIAKYEVAAVFYNRDYEAEVRDDEVANLCKTHTIPVYSYKDQVMYERSEIVKSDGTPYTVFTPYAKRWKAKLTELPFLYDCRAVQFYRQNPIPLPTIEDLGFIPTSIVETRLDRDIVRNYAQTRELPGSLGTTRIGTALRFGSISVRECVRVALEENSDTWLNELIWREFFMQILYHYPHVVQHAFKPQYDRIPWRNREDEFEKWCSGNTGYPLVDAGMRELNATGFMHNRVRMVVASFLCKHLLIDWRWGEAYFAQKLNDYELSANNGNWQWAAGSGCDAAPYFRVFNPERQAEKFDKDRSYVCTWIPELDTEAYPKKMVDHAFARERALSVYKKGLHSI